MIWQTFVAAAIFAQAPAAEPAPNVVPRCIVSVIDDIKVPAQESGVLTSIEVKEGMLIDKDKQMAQITDRLARLQKLVAEAEATVTRIKAVDDVNIRYAEAAFHVAEKELQLNEKASALQPIASQIELNKLRLQKEQARLQIEKAENERKIAGAEAQASAAKVDLADEQINRRQIKSPVHGEVVEILVRPGEWVEPGNPVFRVVGMQKLRVEGFANFAKLSPGEVSSRPVKVSVILSHGRVETFDGKIVFVNPVVLAGGMYRVWAEVENRIENGQYLLRPGLEAEMRIDTGAPPRLSAITQ